MCSEQKTLVKSLQGAKVLVEKDFDLILDIWLPWQGYPAFLPFFQPDCGSLRSQSVKLRNTYKTRIRT
jgi:hypothetical protein